MNESRMRWLPAIPFGASVPRGPHWVLCSVRWKGKRACQVYTVQRSEQRVWSLYPNIKWISFLAPYEWGYTVYILCVSLLSPTLYSYFLTGVGVTLSTFNYSLNYTQIFYAFFSTCTIFHNKRRKSQGVQDSYWSVLFSRGNLKRALSFSCRKGDLGFCKNWGNKFFTWGHCLRASQLSFPVT